MATENVHEAPRGKLSRRAAIVRFLFRYRNSGVFQGLRFDAQHAESDAGEGSPEQFAHEMEAMGPTFVKLGQMLSTRPDLVPPLYAAALERMQEKSASSPSSSA